MAKNMDQAVFFLLIGNGEISVDN